MSLAAEQLASYRKAEALIEAGRHQQAGALLAPLVADHPDQAMPRARWAQCLMRTGHPQEALAEAERALAADRECVLAWLLRVHGLRELGRIQESAAAAAEAVAVVPHNWGIHLERAVSLLRLPGWAGEAHRCAAEAVRLAPHQPQPHYVLGVAAQLQGRTDEAARAFRTALSIDPQHTESRNELAVLHLRAGRVAEATEGFAGAVAADPQHARSRFNVQAAALRVVIRARWIALGCLLVGCGGGSLAGGNAVFRAGLVGVQAVLWLGWASRMLRPLTPEPRRLVMRLVRRSLPVGTAAVGVAVCTVCGLVAAAVPMPAGGRGKLWLGGLVAQAVSVWTAALVNKARRRRLLAGEEP